MRPTLTEAHWKKAGSLVQGWGAVQENGKLKKIVADLSLDKAMLQDVIRRKL